jgi:epoxyqueuosine reductase QueG
LRRPETEIRAIVARFIATSPENTLQNQRNDKAWEAPLVGFSNGDDSLYAFYQRDIGGFYLSPLEIFTRAFPDAGITPRELTVISWILPHNEKTKADNRRRTVYPSERWARARIYGEQVNDALRRHVVARLGTVGVEAVAPVLAPFWKVYGRSKYGRASNWSERHAAYASGLGTFGLCEGLITAKGKAMRCGSVIANISVRPTPRPYRSHQAYCLFYAQGTCGVCIQRCPVGAISEAGHDKILCRNHNHATRAFVRRRYGFEGYGCGMCQTRVPCESRIPRPADV